MIEVYAPLETISEVAKEDPAKRQAKPLSTRRRSWMLLTICLVILGVGLAVRYGLRARRVHQIGELRSAIDSARQKEDWPSVEVLARDWALLEPLEYQPWGHAADAALALGDVELAAGYLSRMPDDSPLAAFQELGFMQMEQLNQPLAAVATCLRTLKSYPDDSESHERLLFFYTMTCQRESIAQEAFRAIDAGGDTLATYAYLFGARWLTFANGYDANHLWLATHPDNELFEVAAVIHLIAKRIPADLPQVDDSATATVENAEASFYQQGLRRLRLKYPDNIELLAAELSSLCQAGETRAVAELLTDAPSATLQDNRFWRFKGWFHSAQEEWVEAVAAYEKSLELYPFDWATEFQLVAALRASGEAAALASMQERALLSQQLTRIIQLSDNIHQLQPASVYADLQRYYRMCGRDDLAQHLGERLVTRRMGTAKK